MATEDQVRQLDNFTSPGSLSVQVDTTQLEAATQSYLAGAPVKAVNGLITVFTEDGIAGLVGFACFNASGVTNNPTSIIPAVPGIEFEATLENGSTGDYALTQADLWAAYGLAVTAGGLWYLDKAETTHKAAVITRLVDPVGTVQGRVRARILTAVIVDGQTTA